MSQKPITLAIIQDAISEVTCLFSLPEVYRRIRELMDDAHSDLEDFSKIVITDPNLTACMLKIVNSAYFGFTGHIASIHQALNVLGIGQLHDWVLSISAVGSLSMPNDIIEMAHFWRCSIYCGVLSKLLGEHQQLKEPGSLFVIGLLREIGHLVFFFKFLQQSRQVLLEAEQTVRSMMMIEREIFSLHYGEAGQQLMKFWHLPVKFQFITAFHPEPATAQEHQVETAIVHIAHHYA